MIDANLRSSLGLNPLTGVLSQELDQHHRVGQVGESRTGLRDPLAFEKVAPRLLALVVVLDHGQLLRHVDGGVVLDAGPAFFGGFRKSHEVLIFHESVLFDPRFDPRGEVISVLEEFVKVAGVDRLDELPVDGAGGRADRRLRQCPEAKRISTNAAPKIAKIRPASCQSVGSWETRPSSLATSC